MSRRRTSPFPDGWIDEGPQSAVSRSRTYATVPGAPVGDMTPIIVGLVLAMQGSHAGHGRRAQAYSIRPENRHPSRMQRRLAPESEYPEGDAPPGRPYDGLPRCGAMMRIAKEPCARLAGHKREHLTRARLVAANESRRSPRKAA